MDVILSCLKILVSLLYPDFFPRVNIAFTSKFWVYKIYQSSMLIQ